MMFFGLGGIFYCEFLESLLPTPQVAYFGGLTDANT